MEYRAYKLVASMLNRILRNHCDLSCDIGHESLGLICKMKGLGSMILCNILRLVFPHSARDSNVKEAGTIIMLLTLLFV